MTARVDREGLKVAAELATFIEAEALPGSGVAPGAFWAGLSALVRDMAPRTAALLATRAQMQAQIDAWHRANPGRPDPAAYRAHLAEIGYLVPEGPDFTVDTTGTDPEIAALAGPQLVVPVTNARYALNAANARWGSLYDALYGTDALGDAPAPGPFDAARGARVVAWARAHLDAVAPLAGASWADITGLRVDAGALHADTAAGPVTLANPAQFAGSAPGRCLLRVNGLHLEIVIDPATPIGQTDRAGISDVRIESALSAIMDCEDSVACVDAADKVGAYRNWLGLMKGDLAETVTKGGRTFTRRLNADATYTAPDGGPLTLKSRALMLVRNVGHLMTTPAVLTAGGEEVPEGLLDAMVTVLCACHDLRGARRNSAAGSVYVVKPKMHGPDEVALAVETFDRVEDALGLPRNTVKLGIMDEERRTSANLRECLRAARHRVAFINTGFLDRTGDEIHTSMQAGPML
nr:malate synthase G [Paracoccaceae bacterium]